MNIFQRNAKKVVVAAVLAASFSAIFVRLVSDVPAMAVGFYRLTFSMPFFAVIVLGFHRKELFSLTKKQVAGCVLAGLFLFAHFFTWFTAIVSTTIASAVVLCSTHPIIIMVLSAIVFKEKTSWKAVLGVIIALTGAGIITSGDYSFAKDALFGDFMAVLGAFFLALNFMCARRLRAGISAGVYVFLVFGSCWVAFGIGMLATSTSFVYTGNEYGWMLMMALFCQIGAHAVFNWCLGYVSPLYVSAFETCEALFAVILGALIFMEIPTVWQIAGGLMAVCGLLVYNYFDSKNQGQLL